jgi:hypothetical protein
MEELVRLVVPRGTKLAVFALVRANACKATDFLDTVDGAGPPRVKARYLRLFQKLANGAALDAKTEGHPLDPKKPPGEKAKGIFEFKDIKSKTRMFAFQAQIGYVVTHGMIGKKEDKLPTVEVERADSDRRWYEEQLAQRAKQASRGKR